MTLRRPNEFRSPSLFIAGPYAYHSFERTRLYGCFQGDSYSVGMQSSTLGISYFREHIPEKVIPWCSDESRFPSSLTLVPKRRGRGDNTGLTSWRSLTPFRVAAPGSAYRRGFRSPEAPTWRLHPQPDAGSAANGGVCRALREASRRQRAPPRASPAGSCGESPWAAGRL